MNLDETLRMASEYWGNPGDGTTLSITVHMMTNQAGWAGRPVRESPSGAVLSYATGNLEYYPEIIIKGSDKFPHTARIPDGLRTPKGKEIPYTFSNRQYYRTEEAKEPNKFGAIGPRQDFDIKQSDLLGIDVQKSGPGAVADFTLRTWGSAKFSVALSPMGGILVGTGPAIGNSARTSEAVYALSFEMEYKYIG